MEDDYVKVAVMAEIQPGKMKAIKIEDKEILLANVEGKYYAVSNRCDHEGVDLSTGTLEGNILTCPKHKAQYDVTTGKAITAPTVKKLLETEHPAIHDLRPYSIKIDLESILIRL
jgi:nitrite reductase/ring-hydroxylating ferredoxin subunit